MKKTSVQSNINLETLAGGAFAEKLNEALMQVAENIQNPNTEAITTKDNVLVPNPVNLIPYRTFLEVEQPASDFVFRVSEGRGGAPVFKLVAADGGVWKSQAVANVKAYLTEALKDIPDRDKITIIA